MKLEDASPGVGKLDSEGNEVGALGGFEMGGWGAILGDRSGLEGEEGKRGD